MKKPAGRQLNAIQASILALIAIVLTTTLFPNSSFAEQLVITDCSGVPRLSKEIVSGSTSAIKLSLSSSVPADFELKLTRVPSGEELPGDVRGDSVIVENVTAGTWKACGYSATSKVGTSIGGAAGVSATTKGGAAGAGAAAGGAEIVQFTEIALIDTAALTAAGVAGAVLGGGALIGGGIAIGDAASDSSPDKDVGSPSRISRPEPPSGPEVQPVSDTSGTDSRSNSPRSRRPGETLADSDCDTDEEPIPLSPVS